MGNEDKYSQLDEVGKNIVDRLFPKEQKSAEPALVAINDPHSFEPESFGRVPVDVKVVEVVQEGVDTRATLSLSRDGQGLGEFDVLLDSETLEVERSSLAEDSGYPYESSELIDEQVQAYCNEHSISPPLTLDKSRQWIQESLGNQLSLVEHGEEYQLTGDKGIWARSNDIKGLINRLDKVLSSDPQFLKLISLENSDGEVVSRDTAYAREKISQALQVRPDKNLFPEKISEKFKENLSSKSL